MDTSTLVTLIDRRDESVRDLGRFMPTTLQSLYDGQTVTLFDGITIRRIETLSITRDSEWQRYGDVSVAAIIVAVKDNDVEQYFRIEMYYDSWDNDESNEWKIKGEPQEVQKVPVEKYEWKEVW